MYKSNIRYVVFKLYQKGVLKMLKFFKKKVKNQINNLFHDHLKNLGEDNHTSKNLYHSPINFDFETFSVKFNDPVYKKNEPLPIPASEDRMGYSPNSFEEYLETGKYDYNLIKGYIEKYIPEKSSLSILDMGCSTGRVLRHFHSLSLSNDWQLHGIDIQARVIEWLRQYFPKNFQVTTVSSLPHLPYEDQTFDVIYGISVFTHIKYLWDNWLLELKRVLKPNGILIQTCQCEQAWEVYRRNKNLNWLQNQSSHYILKKATLEYDWTFYGDAQISHTFWKEKALKEAWGRYFEVLELEPPPPKYSFQNWIICKKK